MPAHVCRLKYLHTVCRSLSTRPGDRDLWREHESCQAVGSARVTDRGQRGLLNAFADASGAATCSWDDLLSCKSTKHQTFRISLYFEDSK